jgi:hypothetical protein
MELICTIFLLMFCPLLFEVSVGDIKHFGLTFSLGDPNLTRSLPFLIFGPIIFFVFIYIHPYALIYAIPIYIVSRILLNRWFKKRYVGEQISKPDYSNMSCRILNSDLLMTELSKFDSGNFEFIIIEGKSPDTQWLQIIKEEKGYLLNLSPKLKMEGTMLSAENISNIKDLGKIKDNRVFRVICDNTRDGAIAVSKVLSKCKDLEKNYNIIYE